MRILLILNGSPERYAGGGGEGRWRHWLQYCSPGTQLEFGYLPSEEDSGGVARIYDFGSGEALQQAVLYPDRCEQAERDGFDAAIMHCCADPGIEQARARVRIPVIGPGEASMRSAVMMGARFGLTVPSDPTIEAHQEQAERLGVAGQLAGVESLNRGVPQALARDGDATEAIIAAGKRLRDRGAEVICPMGLAFVPLRVSAAEVASRVGVPVIDPAFVAVRMAEMLVEARVIRPLVAA